MRPHEKLDLWRRAIDFVVRLYRVTDRFPKEEKFGLTSQLRCAAVRWRPKSPRVRHALRSKEFMQFLSHSEGSASEVDTELLIASRLGCLSEKDYQDLAGDIDDIGRMITRLSQSLKRRAT